jgi:hypothetical protein
VTIPLFPEAETRPPGRDLIGARIAASVGLAVSLLPPRRIAAVLSALSKRSRPASLEQALKARSAVCTVSVRCAGQGCLQRSIAVFLLCRMQGSTPDWATGFLNRPFVAHAWVEVDGVPVGEPSEVADYVTILAVRPRGEFA